LTPPNPPSAQGARAAVLSLLSLGLGLVAAFLIAEAAFRLLGIRPEPAGRIFRISNGAALQFPGRAGHTVIDLYASNPRRSFPIDLNDPAVREDLVRRKFTRVDEARATNPYGVAFDFNSRGFRDREFTPKPPGTRRLAFVGDSFTEAQGVVEGASAVRLVEGLLRRRDGTIEAWNLGVRGRDFPELEALVETALELSPDAILLGIVLNDADRGPELALNWPRLNDSIMVREQTPAWLESRSFFLGFVASRYRTWRVSSDTTAWYRALYGDENRDGWMRTRAALQRIQKLCRSRGIAFGVALWPLLVGLEPSQPYPFEAVLE